MCGTNVIIMRAYIDNNVLISIEEDNYCLKDFKIPGVEYYFSNAHIRELLNGVDKSIQGLKERRLLTIKSVSGSKYLFQDTNSSIQLADCNSLLPSDRLFFGGMLGNACSSLKL